ncbi:MAG: TonB-dependent receptor domain-containing protein [Terriglobia bacterium]
MLPFSRRAARVTSTAVLLALTLLSAWKMPAATIAGKVSSLEGTAVPGAQIVIRQESSEASWTAVTLEDGSYSLPALPAGTYTILVQKPGYEELTQESLAIRDGGETLQLDFRLQPAPQTVVRGVEELNPNLFYVKLDTNEITRDLNRRGADAQFLREFRAQENYFGAQYGHPLRTVEWARTRSALTGFHGSLYEAHQNSRLNARSFFTVGNLRPWRRNEYGGAVGGPLASDRLTFDFAWSQTRDTGYINGNALVPLAEERIPQAADPTTNALIARLLGAFPVELPNLPHVSLRQLNTNAVRDIRSTAFSTRFDYRPNATDQLVLEQRFLDSTEEPFEFVVGQNPVTLLRPQSVHLTYSHPFSPQTLLRLSQNFDRLGVFLDATEAYKNLLAPLGRDVVPEVSFGHELTRLGPGPSYPRRRVENRFHSSGELSQARGNHSLAMGVLVSRLQTNDLQSDNSRGAFSFGRDFGKSTVENFLLGQPTGFLLALGELYRGFRNWEFASYLQDTFRVKPTLTISIGLRHEVVTAPTEVNALTEIPFSTDANNLSPQFGFAWNPGRGATVLRGGYAIAFSSIFPVLYQRARFNPPAVQTIFAPAPSLLDPLRNVELRKSGLNLISSDMVAPYSHLYNLGIERELPANLSLRVGYLGSRTIKLPVIAVSNRARPVPGIPTTTATINQRRPDPRYLEISAAQNGSIAYFDALQIAVDKRTGQGLTWNVRYTFSKAINTTGTQSFANISGAGHTSTVEDIVRDMKSLEQFDTPHSITVGYRYELPWDGQRGILALLAGGWKVAGTTTFKSGTPIHIHTGSDAPGFGNVDGVGGDRPNLLNPAILGKSLDHPDTSTSIWRREYFDTNIAPGGRGNLGFQTFRQDGISNWNVALERDFVFREPVALRFRTEFINFLNHAQFEGPDDEMAFEPFAKIINTANRGRVIQLLLRLQF